MSAPASFATPALPGGPRHGTGASRGFTLIEMLVALTLAGLVSVALLGGLRFGTRVWQAGDAKAEAQAEIEAIQGLLRRHITQAVMPEPVAPVSGTLPAFIGTSDRLHIVSIVPAHVGVGGLYRIEIAVREGPDGNRRLELLWRLYRPNQVRELDDMPEAQETPVGGRRILLDDVREAAFAYYGQRDGTDRPEWHEEWDGRMGLPALIALRLKFATGRGRQWPEFVVQPRLARVEQDR
ncbi:MAG: prepilin-type N-terminal cleavage/methylation domain-containing protein [Alphaproteobacteria bacterium]|nr:MAG: prepilin-type N-terminal cleavage/methylation domain-containing protein [Alphaproteobacteria bacterium]